MKRMITALLAVCLVCGLSVSAFATTVDQQVSPRDVDTNISTTVNPTYTVVIPADVTVDFNATSTDFGEILVESAQIHPGKCIKVTLDSDEALNNSLDPTKVIPYKVMAGTSEFSSGTYLARNDRTELSIAIEQTDWNRAYAGSYSDTVTFTVEYTDIVA